MVEGNLSAAAVTRFALGAGNGVFRDLDLDVRPEAKLVVEGSSHIGVGHQVLFNPEAPGLGLKRLDESRLVLARTYTERR